MGEVGDGSMSFPPKIEYLPTTENADGSMGVDLSDLENPDVTLFASVNFVAGYCRRKSKELRIKVPWELFKFIALLRQMGFSIIELTGSTFIVLREEPRDTILRANVLPEVASGVALMQSENIASSNNSYNLISNQTPRGATSTLKRTPSEIAYALLDWKPVITGSGDIRVEQGPGFQHSSRTFPSVRIVDFGNDNKAVGPQVVQGFSVGPEIPECGVQTKKRPHPANEYDGRWIIYDAPILANEGESVFQLNSASERESVFQLNSASEGESVFQLNSASEGECVFHFKLEFLQDPANKRMFHEWLSFASDYMKKKGYNRGPKAVQTFKQMYDDLMRKFPQAGTGYWNMTMDEKKAYKKDHDRHFPLTFEQEWFAAMENIEKMQPRRVVKKETQRDGQEGVFTQSLPTVITGSANFAGTDCLEETGDDEPDHVEETSFGSSLSQARWKKIDRSPTRCDVYSYAITCYEVLTGVNPFATIDRDLPHSIPGPVPVGSLEIKQRVKHPCQVVADLPSAADCLEEPGDEPYSESETTDVPTEEEVSSVESGASVEFHTEPASTDSHGPRTEPNRKRSADSAFDEDSLFAKIRPFVNQQIEEALLPLISALRSREEDEHKHRQKMLALEREKLALMRQKLECTRRSNAVPASIAK